MKSEGGGDWEDDWITDGHNSREEAYKEALEVLAKEGWGLEAKIVACDENGDELQ